MHVDDAAERIRRASGALRPGEALNEWVDHADRRAVDRELVAFVIALAEGRADDVDVEVDAMSERGIDLDRLVTETIGAAYTVAVRESFSPRR